MKFLNLKMKNQISELDDSTKKSWKGLKVLNISPEISNIQVFVFLYQEYYFKKLNKCFVDLNINGGSLS